MLFLAFMLAQAILVICSPASMPSEDALGGGRSPFSRNPSQAPFVTTGQFPTGTSKRQATSVPTGSGNLSQPTSLVASGAVKMTGSSPLLPLPFDGTATIGVFSPSGRVVSTGIGGLLASKPTPTSPKPITPDITPIPSRFVATGAMRPSLNPIIVESVYTVSDSTSETTKTVPMIVGGGILTPFIATFTSSLDPSGVESTSTAHILQTQIIYATRAVQSWTISPSNLASRTRAVQAVRSAESIGQSFFIRIDHGGGGGGGTGSSETCSGGNPLTTLFDAVSYAINTLDKLGSDIEGGIDDIESDLKNLQTVLSPLDPKLPVPDPPEKPSPDAPSDNPPKNSPDPSPSEPSPSSDSGASTRSASKSPSSTKSMTCSSTVTMSKCSAICTASSSCTTTCYSTMQGCSVRGTTVTTSAIETASRTQYLIFASTSADTSSIDDFLSSKVVEPSAVMYLPPDDRAGIAAFWAIPEDPNAGSTAGLNQTQVGEIGRQPGISLIMTNAVYYEVPGPSVGVSELFVTETSSPPISTPLRTSTPQIRHDVSYPKDLLYAKIPRSLSRRNDVFVDAQFRIPGDSLDVPFELRAVSQPRDFTPRPALADLDYVFLSPAGEGTWVYVVDSGLNRNHQQFAYSCNVVPDNEWIMVQKNTPWNLLHNDPDGHGTGVTSKVCGQDTGVAKKTTIIPVKFDSNTLQSYVMIWTLLRDDIYARRKTLPQTALPGKTVINYSNTAMLKFAWDQCGIEYVKPIMAELMSLGVVIVVAAGNEKVNQGGNPAILRPPASWASSEFPIIVVSAVDREFKPEPYSNYGPQTSVWAVGELNLVASAESDTGYFHKPGTSFAAPQVAGLLAYYLSLPTVPFETTPAGSISSHVYNFFRTGDGAYPRGPNGERVLWNQYQGNFEFLCTPGVFKKGKQGTGPNDACGLPQPSTLATSTTSTQPSQQVSSTLAPPPPPPAPPISSLPPPPPPASPTPPAPSLPIAVPGDPKRSGLPASIIYGGQMHTPSVADMIRCAEEHVQGICL